ncbi:hypothetical protein FJY93_03355 [Candidatus Kaiserbacteria bacterium]|nr:hypothetical protein [Candidatus Kaiserbacteria bacterium]
MAYRRTAFAPHEWYHCYTRTIDKSRPFEDSTHTNRFLESLYLANDAAPMPRIPALREKYSHEDMFALPRGQEIVAIGAYCVMPTHYHLLLQPLTDSGITDFMHKLGTSFTRSYNAQNNRVGNLFIKPFRSKHIDDDNYLRTVTQYIHLNPIELFESKWKQGIVTSYEAAERCLISYQSSSLLEFEGRQRPESAILNREAVDFLNHTRIDLKDILKDMAEYYAFLELDL